MRKSSRKFNELREISFEIGYTKHAEGSCLVSFGDTKVICTASVENKVPFFLKGKGKGWVTAEYGMLPRATVERVDREVTRGKPSGRTQEIQRLIGRSLRASVDLEKLGERQIKVDCDVIQADGGTRVASICGSYVALYVASNRLVQRKIIPETIMSSEIGAVSCGIVNGQALLDLDYREDSSAEADSNFVFTSKGEVIESQFASEDKPISKERFLELYTLAEQGVEKIINMQRKAIFNYLSKSIKI